LLLFGARTDGIRCRCWSLAPPIATGRATAAHPDALGPQRRPRCQGNI